MEKRKKVGIMGGTFNPIHNGHIEMAKRAYEQFALDYVYFMPSGQSYMKQNVLLSNKRVDMVHCAIKKYEYFELSLLEVARKGNTYTYETLEQLHNISPDTDFFFILGADSLMYIDQWKNPEIIFSYASIICAVRESYDKHILNKKIENLANTMNARIYLLDMPQIDISSTMIRQYVKQKKSISEFVPKEVADYIYKEHLYEED